MRKIVKWLVLVGGALTLMCSVPSPTIHAQRGMTDQLALARICWHEEGVYLTDGCAVIHAVIQRVARIGRYSYVEAAQRYSGRVFDPDRRDERRYVAHLYPQHARPRSEAPTHWPETVLRRERVRGEIVVRVIPHAPWPVFRDRWRDLLAHARRIVDGEVTHRCVEDPEHWGCPDCGDRERAESRGWRRISCDDTDNDLRAPNNDFWVVPRVAEI